MKYSARVYGQRFDDAEFLVRDPESDALINPHTLNDVKYAQLVERIQSGVRKIRGRWRVFADVPNLNDTRPEPGKLRPVAKSLKGKPFLYDHSHSVEKRKGRIHSAKVEKNAQGIDELSVVVDITDPDAQLKYVRGELDLFSISVRGSEAYCSICKAPAYSCSYGSWTDCEHTPGQMYEGKKGPELCEVFIRDCVGIEVSAVVDAAYTDTEILNAYHRAAEAGVVPVIDRGAAPHTREQPMLDSEKHAPPSEESAATIDDPIDDNVPAEDPTTEASATSADASVVAELRAQLAAAEQREAAAKEQAFSTAFQSLQDAGYVMPAQREQLRRFATSEGIEVMATFVRSFPSRNTQIAGETSNTAAPDTIDDPARDFAFLDTMVREGKMSKSDADAFRARYGAE